MLSELIPELLDRNASLQEKGIDPVILEEIGIAPAAAC
jgi:hypothetical protein